MKDYSTIVLGAGPAGLGAAHTFSKAGNEFIVLEKESAPGGLMRSYEADGFTFDYAGHIFFSRLPQITELFLKVLKENVHQVTRHSVVHMHDRLINFPFQANLKNLPSPILKKCLLSFIYNWYQENKPEPTNFREWIYYAYGDGIADNFMLPYNEKLWTYNLREISIDWIKDRIAHPDFESVVEGALRGANTSLGHNATFYYPLRGGMYSFIKNFTTPFSSSILLNEEVVKINLEKQIVSTKTCEYRYKKLISTLPLPEFCQMTDLPDKLLRQATRLHHVSVFCVNVGTEKTIDIPYHWYYFPEKQYIFHRIFVQHNASPYTAPKEHNAFTAEISYSAKNPLEKTKAVKMTIEGLIRAGLIKEKENVKHTRTIDIPYGYVVYNNERIGVIQQFKKFLNQYKVHLLGRYGTWEYYNMDHALHEGQKIGKALLYKKD